MRFIYNEDDMLKAAAKVDFGKRKKKKKKEKEKRRKKRKRKRKREKGKKESPGDLLPFLFPFSSSILHTLSQSQFVSLQQDLSSAPLSFSVLTFSSSSFFFFLHRFPVPFFNLTFSVVLAHLVF